MVPSSYVIKYDNTDFSADQRQVKVIVKRGVTHPERIVDSSKSNISVMVAATADDRMLPPYTVYKSKHLYDTWMQGGLNGSGYNRNTSGWFDMCMFEAWFTDILLPYIRRLEGPKLLIGDNLSSHISLHVVQQCEIHNVRFVLLPPNTTHLCQPLDVAFFRPLKLAWRKVLGEWKQHNRGVISKSEFPRLLKQAFDDLGDNKAQNIVACFKKSGIVPFCQQKVLCQIADDNNDDSQDHEKSWTEAFVHHLKKARIGEANQNMGTSKATHKTRLNLVPGKGVVMADLGESST